MAQLRRLRQALDLHGVLATASARGEKLPVVLRRLLRRAVRVFATDAGTFFMVDPESGDLSFAVVEGPARGKLEGRTLPAGEGIAGWVARHGRAQLVRDARRDPRWKSTLAREVGFATRDILAVPIRAGRGQVLGVLELLNKRTHPGFDEKDLRQLQALTASLGAMVENLRLWQQARRSNARLQLLNQVGQLINSTLDAAEVRRRTIEAAKQLVDAEAGSLILLGPRRERLYFEVALGKRAERLKSISLKPGEGLAGWVVSHGRSVVVNDVRADPRWSRRVDRRSGATTRNLVCVPVRNRGRTVGAIQALNKRQGHFDSDDRRALELLAGQVAVAMENAGLYDRLQQTFLESCQALASAIELRDAYTGGHSRRVTRYSLQVGRLLGMDEQQLENLRITAILHDIGKLGVDDRVLRKPGKLDAEEFAQMMRHPQLGESMLAAVEQLAAIRPGIRAHHERVDGRGYPDGLRGQRIPLAARIIAVADTYDAMTSDRPYRRGLPARVAINEIRRCAGSQFDGGVVRAFLDAYRAGEVTGRRERLPPLRRGGGRAPAGGSLGAGGRSRGRHRR